MVNFLATRCDFVFRVVMIFILFVFIEHQQVENLVIFFTQTQKLLCSKKNEVYVVWVMLWNLVRNFHIPHVLVFYVVFFVFCRRQHDVNILTHRILRRVRDDCVLRFFSFCFVVCLLCKEQITSIVETQHKLTIESQNKTTLYFVFFLKIFNCRRQHDVNILMQRNFREEERCLHAPKFFFPNLLISTCFSFVLFQFYINIFYIDEHVRYVQHKTILKSYIGA